MIKYNVLRCIEELNIAPKKYLIGKEIYAIILKNGEVITPSYTTIRFKFDEKNLFIKYGISKGYGSIILNPSIMNGGNNIFFSRIKKPLRHEKIEFPKYGDILNISRNGHSIFKTFITNVHVGSNGTDISLAQTCRITDYSNLVFSYYSIINKNEFNITGEIDGLYLEFLQTSIKKYDRKIKYSAIRKIITSEGVEYD